MKRSERIVTLRVRTASEQNHRCCYCGGRTNEAVVPGQEATLEHIIPRSQGGGYSYDNVVMACLDCNNRRQDHFDAEHFEALGING